MKTTLAKSTILLLLLVGLSSSARAQVISQPRASQHARVSQTIGLTEISIDYSSPSVITPQGQDRTGNIWGTVVPWNDGNQGIPWRAGANENTIISFSDDVTINGKAIAAGSYGLHILTSENDPWTLIFSTNTSSWGSFFYNPEEDALRVSATPAEAPFHKWLTFEFTDRAPQEAEVSLFWENLSLSFTIGVDVHALALQHFTDELRGVEAFSWQGWNQAATYCLNNNIELEQGLAWAERSIAGGFGAQPTFQNLTTKAMLLFRLDRKEESKSTLAEALPMGTVFQLHQIGRQMIAQDEADWALEVFQENARLHPDTWPINVGLARGYSAVGNYKSALKHAKKALEKAPDELNRNSLSTMIEQLQNQQDVN